MRTFNRLINTRGRLLAALALLLCVQLTAHAFTYTYKVIDNSGHEAIALPVTGQSADNAPSLPLAIWSPLVASYSYYSDAQCQTSMSALPEANADVYVRYSVNTSHRLKLDGSAMYSFRLHGRYYGERSDHSVFVGKDSAQPNEMFSWRLEGSDPYNLRIRNASSGYYVTCNSLNADAAVSTASPGGLNIMLVNGTNNAEFALVVGFNTTYNKICAISGANDNSLPIAKNLNYSTQNGNTGSGLGDGARVWFDDPPVVTTYTYSIVDKSNNIAMSIPITGQTAGAAPVLPVAARTSLVSQYYYWSNAECTEALTSLPATSTTIYVTYDVAANHRVKLDGSMAYNFALHQRYYRINGTSLQNEGFGNGPKSTDGWQWKLEGNDPYDVKLSNTTGGTKYYLNFASESGNATLASDPGHRLMLLNGNDNINDNTMKTVTDQVWAMVLAYSPEMYNLGDTDERRTLYALSGSNNNNVGAGAKLYNKASGCANQTNNGATTNNWDNGSRVYIVDIPYAITYKVIDNSDNVALTYSTSTATLDLPDYLKSPLAKNFTYYEENSQHPGDVSHATQLTQMPDHNATVLVRYEYNDANSLPMRNPLDKNAAYVATKIDLSGATAYNMMANSRWFKYDNSSIQRIVDSDNITIEQQLEERNQWKLFGNDPYAIEVRNAGDNSVQVLGKAIMLPHIHNLGNVAMVQHGSSYPRPTVWDSENTKIAYYTFESDLSGSVTGSGRVIAFAKAPDAARFRLHVVDPVDHSIEYIQYTLVRELGSTIALPDERRRPYCDYDDKFYTDAALTQPIVEYDKTVTDIYYTFTLSDEGQKIFTTDESDPQWLYANMLSTISGTEVITYIKRDAGSNHIFANDEERVPDNAHQWALVGNPYLLHIMNREVYQTGGSGTTQYAAMSNNPEGETRKYIDFISGHDNNDWAMLKPSVARGANSFVLRYHKANQDDPDNYYISTAGVGASALKVDTKNDKYATLTVFPVEDYVFHVHKLNGEVLIRTEAQAIGEPVEMTPSSVLFRKYCNYSYYSDWDETNNVGINPIETYPENGSDIHISYTVSEAIPYQSSTSYADAHWYLMAWDNGNNKNYISYNPTENKLYKTGKGTRPATLLEGDQFAFFGDPYDLRIVNRASGESFYLGLDALGQPDMVKMSDSESLYKHWQVTHTSTDKSDSDLDRFMLFLRQGTYNVAGTRWYLDAGATYLQMKSAVNGYGLPLILEAVQPTVEVTFSIYDENHNRVIEKTYASAYEAGSTITDLNPELKRGLCQYTYYESDNLSGEGSSTLNKPLTAGNPVHIYAVYHVTSGVFTTPVLTGNNELDEEATFAAAKWFYISNTDGSSFKYREGVDNNVVINNNHIEADEKDPYLWAFIGDPYHVRVINLYSGAGAYLSQTGEGSTSRFNVPLNSLATAVEWEIIPPSGNGVHDFAARLYGKYERDDLTPKYFCQSGNFASLRAQIFDLRLGIPATFTFRIYRAEDNQLVFDAILNHTYAVGDMVHGLPKALQRKYCSYEYYSEYNGDGVWDESKKFDTSIGAEATAAGQIVYVRYTVSTEGKALFSTAENPVWLNVQVNNHWLSEDIANNGIDTRNTNDILMKSYQWRFEGDPYRFRIRNRRVGENKLVGLTTLPTTGTDQAVGFLDADQDRHTIWAMKVDDNPSHLIFKLSDIDHNWIDTEYLRAYMTRDSRNGRLLVSRNALWAYVQPAADVIDVTYEIRNENGSLMETRKQIDRVVGQNIDIDPRDKRYLVTDYHYFHNVNVDEQGNRSIGDDPKGDVEEITTYTSEMDSTKIFVYYDYEQDKFSNEEGVFNWLNMKFAEKGWTYDMNNQSSTMQLTGTQKALDDITNPSAGLWALMGDPYRMRIVNFAYVKQQQSSSYDDAPGYMANVNGFMVRNRESYNTNDGSTDHWPAYWDELDSEYPKLAVWEYLLNPNDGKGYLALHQTHYQNSVLGNDPVNSSNTLRVGNNNLTSGNGFQDSVEFKPLLKNVTKLTYHVVIGPDSYRPSSMPELTSTVQYYGVGNTLNLPKALRRQYLKYHYWATREDAQAGDASKELKYVIDEWDHQIEDVYVTYELDPAAGFVFSTNTSDLHGPIWYNLTTGSGRDEMMQNQHYAGIRAHYTDNEEHPTYDFWWAAEGDPYGFRLMNRYSADNSQKFTIFSVDESTQQDGVDTGAEGNARMAAADAEGAINVFEMLVGGYKGHFMIRPVHPDAKPLDLMSTTNRIPVQITHEVSQSAANNHNSANWKFIGLESQLKAYLKYAGYAFGLDYDKLHEAVGDEVISRFMNDSETQEDIERVETVMRDVRNFPDDAGLREGYYRLTPMTAPLADNLYASGYLKMSEYNPDESKAGRLNLRDSIANSDTEVSPLFDPSTIFHIKPIAGEPGNYLLSTQGMYVNETYQSKEQPQYHIQITPLGAAVVQLHTEDGIRGFLSYEYYSNGHITHNIELNQNSHTRLQDTKWRLQRVMTDENSLDLDDWKNELPLKIKLVDGKDGYYYSSFYVPYDILLPEGAVAYTSRYTTDDSGSRLTCYSVDFDNLAENRLNDRFVPAGTPVVIKVDGNYVHIDDATGVKAITVTLPNNSPSAGINPDNVLEGAYLTQNLFNERPAADLSGKTVYVFGVGKSGPGFYRNANTDPDPHNAGRGNTYVMHNKAYYLSTPYTTGSTSTGAPKTLGVKMLRYGEDGPIATGVNDIHADGNAIDWEHSRIYDLQGREIHGEPTAGGVYLIVTTNADGTTVTRKLRF